jgi:TetR/AcrR family tetracycline transcriptional repressor
MARDVERTGRKLAHLQREKIVQVALNLLNEVGLDGLTMRRLADHLNVQVAALYWHFKNKQELLNAMAEAMLADCSRDISDTEDWTQRLQTLAQNLRQALLAYHDGARVFAGTYVTEENTLRSAEIFCRTLYQAGYQPSSVFGAAWTIGYYIIGFTIEEQAFLSSVDTAQRVMLAGALPNPEFPTLSMLQPFFENWDFDARFRYGLGLIIEGLRKERDEQVKEDRSADV